MTRLVTTYLSIDHFLAEVNKRLDHGSDDIVLGPYSREHYFHELLDFPYPIVNEDHRAHCIFPRHETNTPANNMFGFGFAYIEKGMMQNETLHAYEALRVVIRKPLDIGQFSLPPMDIRILYSPGLEEHMFRRQDYRLFLGLYSRPANFCNAIPSLWFTGDHWQN